MALKYQWQFKMQSYEIVLNKHQPFIFYKNSDNIYLNINDSKESFPSNIKWIWNNSSRNIERNPLYNISSAHNKIICPTYLVSKGDYLHFVKHNMIEMIKTTLLIGVPENSPEYSLFTAFKKIDNDKNNIEAAIFCYPGIGKKQNKKIQKMLDSYFNLKVFW